MKLRRDDPEALAQIFRVLLLLILALIFIYAISQ